MRQVLKWLGFIVGGLLLITLLAFLGLVAIVQTQINRRYEITVNPVTVPTGADAIERGRHVAQLGFCAECHGPDWSGDQFDEGPLVGSLTVANLTAGRGGVGQTYTDEDWVRAIRHGVDPGGRTLLGMESTIYYHLSDTDLGALIAYIKTLPPVDKELPETRLGPMGMAMVLMEAEHFFPARYIQHDAPRPADVAPGVTAEYGEYLATLTCKSCHGQQMSGGSNAWSGGNLTPGGALAGWSEDDFIAALRTGERPDGSILDGDMMPWRETAKLSDDELRALWRYLQSLPAIVSTPTPGP